MILVVRLALLIIFVALLVVLVRRVFPRTEIVDGKPASNKYLMLASVGTFFVLVVLVAAAEYITRL